MRRLLWNVHLRSSPHPHVQLLRVLHRYPRRPIACAVAVAAATAVASATALASSGGELHRLQRHLQRHRPDMRRLLWTVHLRAYSQHPKLPLLRVLHGYRRRPVACADVAVAATAVALAAAAIALAAAAQPAAALASGLAQPASAPIERRREHNHSGASTALAATALALAAAAQSAAAQPTAAVAVAAVAVAVATAAGLATNWLLYRRRRGLSGRGGYDCIGRHVPEMEHPEPAHPRPRRVGRPQLLPQP